MVGDRIDVFANNGEVVDSDAAGRNLAIKVTDNAEVSIGTRKGRGKVIDVSAAMLVVNHTAYGQPIGNDGDVKGRVEIAALPTVHSRRVACVHRCFSHVEFRLVRDVTHNTRLRARSE